MLTDYFELGSSPTDEDCAQVGTPEYLERMRIETRQLIRMLEEHHPVPDGLRGRLGCPRVALFRTTGHEGHHVSSHDLRDIGNVVRPKPKRQAKKPILTNQPRQPIRLRPKRAILLSMKFFLIRPGLTLRLNLLKLKMSALKMLT